MLYSRIHCLSPSRSLSFIFRQQFGNFASRQTNFSKTRSWTSQWYSYRKVCDKLLAMCLILCIFIDCKLLTCFQCFKVWNPLPNRHELKILNNTFSVILHRLVHVYPFNVYPFVNVYPFDFVK